MPHPSTLADEAASRPPRRSFRDALPAFLSGSIATFLVAFLLVLGLVGLVAGLFVVLVSALTGHSLF